MKLLAKFNLIFLLVFGAGLAVAVWLASNFLRENAKEQVLGQANLMMQSTLATRTYTTRQIKPLLVNDQRRKEQFLPQQVPAYSATEVFNYLHERYPDYAYKEATLNPTNLRDRATDWEADVIYRFRNKPDQTMYAGERITPDGNRSLFLARPLRIDDPACLDCHTVPSHAPVSMIRQYGPNNGFGWKLHEIIGAQIVSIPMALPLQIADRALRTSIIYLIVLGVFTLVILDAVLIATVIRPVARMSRMADEISQGKLQVEELSVKGRDEISVLALAFNRMQRSLAKAMKMLEADDEHIQES